MSGIQEPASIEEYVRHVWGDTNSCMSPHDRADAVVGHVNEQLAAFGVPLVGWQFDASKADGAVFHHATWEILIGDKPYAMEIAENGNVADQAWQVSSVYHEGRHAEQFWRMTQERMALGGAPEKVAAELEIPVHIAQYAAVFAPGNHSDAETNDWYQSIYGTGEAHREQVLADPHAHYAEYRALPEEKDAWTAGHAVTQEYTHYSQHPGGH